MPDKIYIVLLRGINVGGKTLKMADLRDAVAQFGFENVRTYLQSGNLVLRAKATNACDVASMISGAIDDRCGMKVHVLAYDMDQWAKLLAGNPFPAAGENPKAVHAFMLDAQPSRQRVDDLAAKDWGTDEWKIVGDTLYMHTPDGFGRSKLAQGVERALKVAMTARNWNTMRALAEMADES